MGLVQNTIVQHRQRFGPAEVLVKSPGRVNIIGEHIDYNGGKVLPFAIDQAIYLALSQNSQQHHRIFSEDFGLSDLTDLKPWSRYVTVAMRFLQEQFGIGFYDMTIVSDLPVGAGMSSSSALVLGILKAVSVLEELALTDEKLLEMSSGIEYGAGVEGGLMDQLTILHGKADKMLYINCKNNQIEYIEHPEKLKWYVLNTGMRHDLAASDYNLRKHSCERILEAAQPIAAYQWIVDMTEQDIERLDIGDREKDMAYHIIDEQKRVESMVFNMLNANFNKVGLLLNHSHVSLSELYRVSTLSMDMLADIVRSVPDVLGCRMMGGGFGGSIIIASQSDFTDLEPMLDLIEKRGLGRMELIPVKPSDGLTVLNNF